MATKAQRSLEASGGRRGRTAARRRGRTAAERRRALALALAVLTALSAAATVDAGPSRFSRLDDSALPHAARLALLTEPRDGMQPLLALIEDARHRVEMTMYELGDRRVEDALVRARKRGVSVRVLLDCRGYSPARLNAPAAARLRRGGVAVRCASDRYPLTHQKSLTTDGRLALIASFNLTPRYYSTDRDFAVIDGRRTDVAAVEAAFAADWRLAGDQSVGGRFRRAALRRRDGSLVFSPRAQPQIVGLLHSARHTLQVEAEELSDRAADSALCAAARRGVRVQLTMTYARPLAASLRALADCGAHVRVYPPHNSLYIHAKAIVIDGRVAFIGSENLSEQSLCCNRELGIFFSARPLVRSLSATLHSDFARAQSIARR